jgi:hypothetical protein
VSRLDLFWLGFGSIELAFSTPYNQHRVILGRPRGRPAESIVCRGDIVASSGTRRQQFFQSGCVLCPSPPEALSVPRAEWLSVPGDGHTNEETNTNRIVFFCCCWLNDQINKTNGQGRLAHDLPAAPPSLALNLAIPRRLTPLACHAYVHSPPPFRLKRKTFLFKTRMATGRDQVSLVGCQRESHPAVHLHKDHACCMLHAACIVAHSKHYLRLVPACRFVGNVCEHLPFMLCERCRWGPGLEKCTGELGTLLRGGRVLAELPERAIPPRKLCFAK